MGDPEGLRVRQTPGRRQIGRPVKDRSRLRPLLLNLRQNLEARKKDLMDFQDMFIPKVGGLSDFLTLLKLTSPKLSKKNLKGP